MVWYTTLAYSPRTPAPHTFSVTAAASVTFTLSFAITFPVTTIAAAACASNADGFSLS